MGLVLSFLIATFMSLMQMQINTDNINDLDALQSSNDGFTTLKLTIDEFPAEPHECGVCNELYGAADIIQLLTCTHAFCRECLRTFTKTRINEGRYPIFCPVCAIERTRVNQSREFVLSHLLVN